MGHIRFSELLLESESEELLRLLAAFTGEYELDVDENDQIREHGKNNKNRSSPDATLS